ncbi:MAG TPA: hypothetical protein VFV97_03425 [Rhodanobacteraceae bacterium]|nr:hypothetical protein [Rhodanobacteraceae bacterium]
MIGLLGGGARGAAPKAVRGFHRICACIAVLLFLSATAFMPRAATAGQQTVSGRVTNDLTGEPLAGMQLIIYYNTSPFSYLVIGTPVTDADGRYSWTGACPEWSPPVPCFVELFADGYLDAYQVFDYRDGDVMFDFALIPGATVSGDLTIDGAAADRPLGATIEYFNEESGYWDSPIAVTSEEANGHYTLGRLPYDESYRVCAGGVGFDVVQQCYDGHERSSLSSDPLFDAVVLSEGEHREGIDFAFRSGGTIEGTLRDAYLGMPLMNRQVDVRIYDAAGNWVATTTRTSGADGRYRVAGLPDGTYYAAIATNDDAFSDSTQLYPGVACPDDCSPLTDGAPITIANGAIVDGVDFTFHPDIVIEGRVTDAATGAPLGGIHVMVYLDYAPAAITAADGSYRFYASHLRGTVRVFTRDSQPLVDQVYPALPCILSECLTQGEGLPATTGSVYRNIDFALTLGASIAGHLTDATTGLNVSGYVYLYDASFALVWTGGSDENARYASGAWLPGTYYAKVIAFTTDAMVCAFYDARPCPDDGVDPSTVMPTPIVLSLGEVRSDIDFAVRGDAIFAGGFDP